MTRNQQIIRDYSRGATGEEIGRQHGITRQRVYQILIRYGVEVRPRVGNPAALEKWRSAGGKRSYPCDVTRNASIIAMRSAGVGPRAEHRRRRAASRRRLHRRERTWLRCPSVYPPGRGRGGWIRHVRQRRQALWRQRLNRHRMGAGRMNAFRPAPTCSVRNCGKLAAFAKGGYEFCTEHKPTEPVTAEKVRLARLAMLRRDWSLAAIATDLHVRRDELDIALWRHVEEPFRRIPSGDF